MTPRLLFEQLWARGDELGLIYDSLVTMGIPQSRADELLRAEWVTRLAALDLYVHELLASRMVSQFESGASNCAGFNKFRLSAEAMWRIVQAGSLSERSAAFDLDVRAQISHLTFQMPDRIADAIRYTSDVQLWKEVARHENPGATPAELNHHQATLKTQLSSMVERRNKIAHEGDLGPTVPRQTLPISLDQLVLVRTVVKRLVDSIEAVVDAHDAEILAASAVAEASEAGEQAGVPAASDDAPNELQDSPSESPNSADAPIEPVWIEPSGGGEPGGQQA